MAGADLVNTDLTGINLNGASLKAAHLGGCVLKKADLRRSDWTQAAVWETTLVSFLAWSPDGQQLACLGDGVAVWIWHLGRATPTIVRVPGRIRKIRWSPTGDRLAAGTENHGVLVWDAASLQLSAILQIEGYRAFGLDFSPDGRYLIAGGYRMAVFAADTGRIHHPADPTRIFDVEYSPTGEIAAVARSIARPTRDERSAALLDASTGSTLLQWSPQDDDEVRSVTFVTPDHVVTLGTRVSVWKGGRLIAKLPGHSPRAIAAAPSSNLLAVGYLSGKVEIWFGIPPKLQLSFTAHSSWIASRSFTRDGKYLASGGNDSTARIWPVSQLDAKPIDPIKVLHMNMDCTGAQISGATGLEERMTWVKHGRTYEGPLVEFFAARGAILDGEQGP